MAATRKIDLPMNKIKRFLESAASHVLKLFNTPFKDGKERCTVTCIYFSGKDGRIFKRVYNIERNAITLSDITLKWKATIRLYRMTFHLNI